MNLRTKLIIPIVLALLVFALAEHLYWRPILLDQEKDEVIEREVDVLRNMVPGLLSDLLTGDLAAVYVTLDRLLEINADEGYQIELFNAQGKRLYPLVSPKEISSPYILKLEQTLEFEHGLLGTLQVKIDWKERYEKIEAQIWGIELTVFFLFGFVLLAILALQEWIIGRPLISMKDASLHLAKGDFEIDLPTHIKDEVGELARSFDHMRQNLKQTQEALTRKAEEAERANATKSEFLSRMSHELRTPMNAILGFAQLLELDAEGFNDNQRANVKEILDAGHHLMDLINDVLDLAKIESGKLEVSMEKVYLDDVLQQCLVMIQHQAEIRQIELVNNVNNKGYTVQADFISFKQVLLNILTNAVKYNREQGRITLDAKIIDKQRLRIDITDTGQGLTEEEINRLFESFERLNVINNIEGTGIGLVITKHLIELMDGSIGVESTAGKGSTFWLELNIT